MRDKRDHKIKPAQTMMLAPANRRENAAARYHIYYYAARLTGSARLAFSLSSHLFATDATTTAHSSLFIFKA
jgi:hypothetical protein